jgi:hypothetical protein
VNQNTEELIRSLTECTTPVKTASHPLITLAGWFVAGSVYAALALSSLGLRSDLSQWLATPLYLLEFLLLLVLTVNAGAAAIWLGFPDIRQNKWIYKSANITALLFVILVGYRLLSEPVMFDSETVMHGIWCLFFIAVISIIPAFLIMFILHRHATTHLRQAGAMALLAASAMGNVSVNRKIQYCICCFGIICRSRFLQLLEYGSEAVFCAGNFICNHFL